CGAPVTPNCFPLTIWQRFSGQMITNPKIRANACTCTSRSYVNDAYRSASSLWRTGESAVAIACSMIEACTWGCAMFVGTMPTGAGGGFVCGHAAASDGKLLLIRERRDG